ncbi:hypothetical protein K7X08_006293 [Anisodus acutangulus]|uniref:Uncharacterized protein n=1 Tax=Anisodus acutangulus TaxID=402998 RepID=A0A9Q1N150_9SOLA|nr:hypothetical protein K7X08_006293 [Anisodus acutangulus]
MDILEQVHALGIQFVFQDLVECNIHLVREAYANWTCEEALDDICVRGVVAPFTNNELCEFLSTLVVSSKPYDEIYVHHPYRALHHLLCGQHSTSHWERRKKDVIQRHAMNDSIITNMYAMQNLHLTLGATAAIPEQFAEINERFPLSSHAMILCKYGEAFAEPVDDDMPTPESEPHVEPASEEEAEIAA